MDKPRVAIIGAGVTGLTAIKQCLVAELEPICFEQTDHTGGLWRYTEVTEENQNPHSSVYRSTVINTSKEHMTFSDFPIPEDWPTFLPHYKVAEYYDLYADKFNLWRHIRFNTTILNASMIPETKKWKIVSIKKGGEKEEEEFDYVMVCTGHHNVPRLPNYQGMKTFPGKQIHSHFYREPFAYAGKRVVVVGVGNSGMDMSVELSHYASQVYLVSRRGRLPWILPRRGPFGRPFDHSNSRFAGMLPGFIRNYIARLVISLTTGLPPKHLRPLYPFSAAHPSVKPEFLDRLSTGTIVVKPDILSLTTDGSVSFVDNTIVDNIDVIFYCTGYNNEVRFMDTEIINGGDIVRKNFDEGEYRENITWLYKFMFPPRWSNIAFLGFIQQIGAIMPMCELQARYVTALIKGKISPLPSSEEMDKRIMAYHTRNRKRFYEAARHTMEIEMMPYCDTIARDIGCYPTLTKVLWKYGFGIWRRVLFGVPTPMQFRLLGPDAWPDAAKWIYIYNKG
ncbi:8492_t:CDS:2 [Paraglomus brasilianum]|uniref:Flavin-containing monooxygenase 1 n=1 Tax=Paraglomus brasilianum TaxID=144538 RepID=A0A9N9D1G0_9GLOM|nr:8492_t:CDS:2 [Paraglomus brasilianum]